MSLNQKDRNNVVKEAKNNGYRWASDGTKMINGQGDTAKFSGSGGSIDVNGAKYNTVSGAKRSTKW